MTWGLLRPKLLLPEEAEDWPDERRRVVLLHELAHVKRWDYLTNLITQIVCALYWFNPLIWVASRRMVTERERACDDIVLSQGAKPADYADQLLRIAAGLPADGFVAFGAIAMARPSKLESRLLAILDGHRNRRAVTRLAVLICVILLIAVVFPLAMMRAAAQDSDKKHPGLFRSLAELGRAKARAARDSGGNASRHSFAPAVVRVLKANHECFLDLDTGQTCGPVIIGGETDLPQGMDLSIVYSQVEGEVRAESVVGLDHLDVLPTASADWDIAPDELSKRMAELDDRVIGGGTKAAQLATRKSELPRTFLFRTAKGNPGVLQLLALNDNPGGVNLRYKLARTQPAAARIDAPRGQGLTPREVVQRWLELAQAGKGGETWQWIVPKSKSVLGPEEIHRFNNRARIEPKRSLGNEEAAMVVTTRFKDNSDRERVAYFHLRRQAGRWLINESELASPDDAQRRVEGFAAHPDVKFDVRREDFFGTWIGGGFLIPIFHTFEADGTYTSRFKNEQGTETVHEGTWEFDQRSASLIRRWDRNLQIMSSVIQLGEDFFQLGDGDGRRTGFNRQKEPAANVNGKATN